MKRLMIGVAALGLLAGSAYAQPYGASNRNAPGMERHDNRGDWRHDRRGGGQFNYRGRAYNRVHGPAWVAPRGWAYRRYTAGAYLPRNLLTMGFVVSPAAYGVRTARTPAGYRWVRVGDDLLLVSWRTGRVTEVIPNVFY